MTDHTPGPANENERILLDDNPGVQRMRAEGGHYVSELVRLREQNADLLAALERIADRSWDEATVDGRNVAEMVHVARTAIAKAKGGGDA